MTGNLVSIPARYPAKQSSRQSCRDRQPDTEINTTYRLYQLIKEVPVSSRQNHSLEDIRHLWPTDRSSTADRVTCMPKEYIPRQAFHYIIPSAPTIWKRPSISIFLQAIKPALLQSGSYQTSETETESTLPPFAMSNWTYPMCVACKHATPPSVSPTWQRIASSMCYH